MLDIFISLVLSTVITIAVKLWFGESGLSAFPVLSFLVITVLSFMVTYGVHSLFFPHSLL